MEQGSGSSASDLLPLRDQQQTRAGNAEGEFTINWINQAMVWFFRGEHGDLIKKKRDSFVIVVSAIS
jgi:hypothetical protein